MKFALAFANVGPAANPGPAVELAQAAEAAGFESIWTVEHTVVPSGYSSTYPYDPSGRMPGPEDADLPDPLVWLAFLASATTTLRLATGVLILPQRNPVTLAKSAATLDHLSGGRLDLGVGVGWLEEEFVALGSDFATRGRRADEYVAAMRELWSTDVASFDGEFVSFNRCISRPRPAAGSIPIHIGGHSKAAARRAGRLGDGFFPGRGTADELVDLLGVMRAAAEAAGRDPEAIEVTAAGRGAIGSGAVDEVTALAAAGVSRVVVPSFLFWNDPVESMAAYGRDVIDVANG